MVGKGGMKMAASVSSLAIRGDGPSPTAELATIVLSMAGHIRSCSKACEILFGYRHNELLGCHISVLLPRLKEVELAHDDEINPRLKYLCRCATPFLARRRDGETFSSELFLNHLCTEAPCLQLIVRGLGMPGR